MLHIDSKRFARFSRPGHAVTGDRQRTSAQKRERVGYEWAHSLVDDHSRLAYSELHPDERAHTVTGFVQRGLAFFASLDITPKRLMSDNAFTYTKNASLARLLADHHIRHLLIPARRPQVNGKVERYQQTLKREWGGNGAGSVNGARPSASSAASRPEPAPVRMPSLPCPAQTTMRSSIRPM